MLLLKTITTILSFFLFQFCFSQIIVKETIHGKIIVPLGNPEGVTIINLTHNNSTISNAEGDFFIAAKPKDELLFSSVSLETYRKIIKEEDLKPAILPIIMSVKTNQLNEVIVKKSAEINSFSLGITSKKIIQPTQKERQLYTRGDFKAIHLLGLLGGGMALDPIINAINGKTALAKKEIVIERKLDLLEKTKNLFEDEFYIQKLKIPTPYIKGFQYYCIDDQKYIEALKANNKTMLEFLMIKLATDYNALILPQKEGKKD